MLMTDFQERKDHNMRKIISLLLGLTMTAALLSGCTAAAEQHTGTAQGYGGPLTVTVTMNGTDITAVEVTSHQETKGVGTRAIDVLPDMIVREDSVSVDSVSGATVTSEAIKSAVSQAVTGVTLPDSIDMTQAEPMPVASGVGMAATGRLGPGTAEDGSPVYSFNVVFAAADFDDAGRITDLDVDQLEVLSSQFTGFPEEKEAEQDFLAQVSQWTSKGAQGEGYRLPGGTWRQQMDAYEKKMTGMTLDEINAWYGENFSQETGKPVDNADAVSGASISLRDEHGDVLTAIRRAWEDAQRRQAEGTATDLPLPEETVMTDTNTQTDMTGGDESFG